MDALMIKKVRRLARQARGAWCYARTQDTLHGSTRDRVLALIDAYRALYTGECPVCLSTPTHSASYRVRSAVVSYGVLAGALLFCWLAFWDFAGFGWFGPQRFERGGW
jgi:hypothetical protein